MITQSQYFEIEDYLQRECRIIEPKLLEEMMDHFVDSVASIRHQCETFQVAFGQVKENFGGKAGIKKMQRTYQRYTVKFHLRGTLKELISYFRMPYLLRTLAYCLAVSVFVLYYNLTFFGYGESNFWDGGITAGLTAPFLVLPFYVIQQKFETGHFALEARHWASTIQMIAVSLPFGVSGAFMNVIPSPYDKLLTLLCTLGGSLAFLALTRYSQRKMFPEYAWM